MTENLASRVAGLKLCGIVGVLLLPMLVLSYFMVSSLLDDMAFTERQIMGVALTRLVMPVAIGAATGDLAQADEEKLRREGPPLSASLGMAGRLNPALALLATYASDKRYAVEPLIKMQYDSATSANLILDPHAESYHVGSLASMHAPRLLGDFVKLWTLATGAMRDGKVEPAEASALLLATGAWRGAQGRVDQSLEASVAAAARPSAYDEALALSGEIGEHVAHVAKLLGKSPSAEMAGRLKDAKELGSGAVHIVGDIARSWRFATDHFGTLLERRLAAMRLRLAMLLAIAVAACLVGVGGAGLVFRSTLRRLDGVELARDQADSARVEAEVAAAEVQRINEDVVRLNRELARNLSMLREAQEDNLRKGKLAQLGQLTATVAHELRNPLGAVRTSAFLLERKVRDKGLGVEPQIERINNGVTRCDNIISQLLDFARTKAIRPERRGLDDWVTEVVEEQAQHLPAAVAVECRLGTGTLQADFDPGRMSRVLINLIGNAAEAMTGKSDDPARPQPRAPLLVVSTALTARGVEVSVADNGPGIAADHLARIFEPLFTTKSFGTGLGLPEVQKIMEQHGGGLDVASTPGQGATFTAWWPAEQRAALPAQQRASGAA